LLGTEWFGWPTWCSFSTVVSLPEPGGSGKGGCSGSSALAMEMFPAPPRAKVGQLDTRLRVALAFFCSCAVGAWLVLVVVFVATSIVAAVVVVVFCRSCGCRPLLVLVVVGLYLRCGTRMACVLAVSRRSRSASLTGAGQSARSELAVATGRSTAEQQLSQEPVSSANCTPARRRRRTSCELESSGHSSRHAAQVDGMGSAFTHSWGCCAAEVHS
jgi:hypothetical protein